MHLKLLREYNALPEMIMIAISTITLNVWSALKAGDAREADPIPGWGKSPGGGNGNPLQYSYLEIPWTEKYGRLQSMESQRVRYN